MKNLAFALLLAACGASSKPHTTEPTTMAHGLRIKHTAIFVDDQDKALKFYTDVMGFQKKDDFSNGGFRWLTVTDGDGELQLAQPMDPNAKALQASQYQNHAPAQLFYTDDVKADVARIEKAGGKIAMPPTDVTMSMIAQVDDTCGNLIQLVQLKR